MPRYFHVDRTNALQEGQVLGLQRLSELPDDQKIPDGALQAHVEELFPDGLSQHGLGYFFWQNVPAFPLHPGLYDQQSLSDVRSRAIELVFEFVRRSHFADRPSRLQSLFCWETREDAVRFIASSNAASAPVWEIEGESVFRADMNLLGMSTALATSRAAKQYWHGDSLASSPPHWEHFVGPGATVVRRVN